ncbi:hypothetical protein F4778DRAFT_715593 [Xylariomycetidae sp. FL2044]|nr:hypothetical protein F4778DRAFT_715593 [Xylariomycetidae sp. FL2044]
MNKHDSLVKKLFRVHPLQPSNFLGKAVQPITLSNGQVLLAGVIVEAPNTPVCGGSNIYKDPHVFDSHPLLQDAAGHGLSQFWFPARQCDSQ